MKDLFFDFFESGRNPIDPNSIEWRKFSFKEYPRSKFIQLPPPQTPETGFAEILEKRNSQRMFSGNPIPLNLISSLLYMSFGVLHFQLNEDSTALQKRTYPSGGARFPVEIYISLRQSPEYEEGNYHYHPLKHRLEKISEDFQAISDGQPYDFAKKAPMIILFSFSGRNLPKYGTIGYKFGLLEGGHMGQNLYLSASALGLGICAIGGMDYKKAEEAFNLRGETIFYNLVLGFPQNGGNM